MWSFREGLRLLIETLCEWLPTEPLLGVAVRRIERTAEDAPRTSWTVHGEGQDHWPADAVVLTCPAPQQAAIVAELDNELAQRIEAIAYSRIAVVALGYRGSDVPMRGFGAEYNQVGVSLVSHVKNLLGSFPELHDIFRFAL